MKMRAELLVSCAALVICAGLMSSAGAADLITKAPKAEQIGWWYEGFAEIGGRFDLNDPGRRNLGRFYRYEDWTPGVFGNFYLGAHRTGPDPFDVTAYGKNIGWDDQAFGLGVSRPGTYYLDFDWDQTPHNYAFDAKTTYSQIGSNVLATPTYPFPPGPATVTFVNGNTNVFDLGFRRDTASAAGRWTPNDNWDITADYSHMHRKGTQALGAVTFAPPPGRDPQTQVIDTLPKPVDDTTQNANVKAEYAGATPWGKPFNVAFGYGLSLYNDNVGCGSVAGTRPAGGDGNCLTFQNPWVAANSAVNPLWNRYSLPPDNRAQNFTLSGGVGLPWNSRYMATVQYSIMTQDETFMTSNINTAPGITPAVLPRGSLGGDARNLMINNVLNTQITSNLTSTLRYKYYDYHSNQAPMTITGLVTNPDTNNAVTTERAFPVNFNKQNATAQLDYRPWKWLNVGTAYEFERWKRTYGDALDVVTGQTGDFSLTTNENAVKVFADARLWGFSTWRTSVRYGERRRDGDYINPLNNANQFQMAYVQNVDSTIVKSSWAIDVTRGLTLTPTGGYRLDDYPADGRTQSGITKYESWNAGADLTWAINPMAALYVSYVHEDGIRQVYETGTPSTLVLDSRDLNDTFIVGGKWTAIPDKLFLNASYTYSRGNSKWSSECGPGGCLGLGASPWPVFPDVHNTNQRVDAWAKYMLDPTYLRNTGFFANALPYVKARVVWEQNSNDSWQNVQQQLGWQVTPGDTTQARAVYLGMSNPNYNVVVGMLSFGMKW